MRQVGVLLLVSLLSGCAAGQHQTRFVRQRIAVSNWCYLTLIEDRRTGLCLAAYSCSRRPTSLAVVPKEVCQP